MFWKIPKTIMAETNSPSLSDNQSHWLNKFPDTRCYFGGGGTSVSMVDPYAGTGVRELYQQLINTMISPQIGQGVTPYGGQMAAGVSPLQQQGFGLATGLSPLVTGPQQYYQDVLGQQAAGGGPMQQLAGTTLQNLMQPYDMGAEREYWQQSFVNPAMQAWREQVAPGIMERYGVDGVGGSLGQQLGRSGQELMTNLSGQLANILYSGQQAQLGRQQTGVNQAMGLAQLPGQIMGQAGQIGGMGTDILSQLLNMGTMQRGITQEQLQEPYAKWQQAQPWANPYLQNYLQMALGQPGQEAIATQQAPSALSQMMPALGMGLGGYMMSGGTLGTMGSSLIPGGLGGLAGGALGGLGGLAGGALSGLGALAALI